jgi:hypothetical protein
MTAFAIDILAIDGLIAYGERIGARRAANN